MAQQVSQGACSASTDYYLHEKWTQFKKELKQEYDMIAQMHLTLLQLEDNPQVFASIGPFDEFYAVDGFNEAKPSPA